MNTKPFIFFFYVNTILFYHSSIFIMIIKISKQYTVCLCYSSCSSLLSVLNIFLCSIKFVLSLLFLFMHAIYALKSHVQCRYGQPWSHIRYLLKKGDTLKEINLELEIEKFINCEGHIDTQWLRNIHYMFICS